MTEAFDAVLGLDIGGTSTRAAIYAQGRVVGRAADAGANVNSSPGAAAQVLRRLLPAALSQARETIGEVNVRTCVAGAAGAGAAAHDEVLALIAAEVRQAAMKPKRLEVVPDPVIAFAAGSSTSDGTVLLAGTGAVAFSIRDFTQSARADGLGWLLGDVGSGVWLGIEGLRAAAAALDNRGAHTALTEHAARFASSIAPRTDDPRQDLIRVVKTLTPAELGSFAPDVVQACEAGDDVARQIVDRGVTGLLATLDALGASRDEVVLAGSVLTTPGPVRSGVLARLDRPTADAAEPVLGAVRLACHYSGWALPSPVSIG